MKTNHMKYNNINVRIDTLSSPTMTAVYYSYDGVAVKNKYKYTKYTYYEVMYCNYNESNGIKVNKYEIR